MLYLFSDRKPLLSQLARHGFEFDQKLHRALEVSASRPDVEPEDSGFPDSYLTVALYRLNTVLTDLIDLDSTHLNLFHDYKLAPPCAPEEVRPGTRLCRILERAANIASPSKTIGVGHFVRAIVELTLDEPAEAAYGFQNQVIHNTFSAETLLWGLGHTAWTPLERAPELRTILQALAGRNPVEDFQYLLTMERGRIVFRPTSIIGAFRMVSDSASRVAARLAVMPHFKDRFASVTPDELLELEDLVNNRATREDDLQTFFEKHPQFLRLWDHREVFSHVYMTREDEGPLIPDFLLLDRQMQKAMIVDLKLPAARVVVAKKNRDRFSAMVEEARAQLLEYRDWFEDKSNRSKLKERFGMDIYRPRLGVIIGSSSDFLSAFDRQKVQSRYPDIELATYDDVLACARRRLSIVGGL